MHDTLNVKIEERIVKLIDKAISANTHQLDPEWYQIIINNWAQITVFLGLIGFIVAKFIDRKIRKEEISFSWVQENKISEVKAFYKSYQALELSLKSFAHQTQFGEHKEEIFDEIREKFRVRLIDFQYHCMAVKLFLSDKQVIIIEQISRVFEDTRMDLVTLHIYKNSITPHDGWDKLDEIIQERLPKKLPSLIKELETSLRIDYKLI